MGSRSHAEDSRGGSVASETKFIADQRGTVVIAQAACFDTTFHADMPDVASTLVQHPVNSFTY